MGGCLKIIGGAVVLLIGAIAIIVVLATHSPSDKAAKNTVRVARASIQKAGFNTVLRADFILQNDGDKAAKDIDVECLGYAPSGTLIDHNSRTIYRVAAPKSALYVDNFDMGFVNSQATSFKCSVTGSVIVE